MYIYCNNNPVMYVDPNGNSFQSWLKDKWSDITNWVKDNIGFNVDSETNSITHYYFFTEDEAGDGVVSNNEEKNINITLNITNCSDFGLEIEEKGIFIGTDGAGYSIEKGNVTYSYFINSDGRFCQRETIYNDGEDSYEYVQQDIDLPEIIATPVIAYGVFAVGATLGGFVSGLAGGFSFA